MSWLKVAVANAQAPKKGVIDLLRKNLGGWQPARDIQVLHASDITKPRFCARKWVILREEHKPLKDQYVTAALQATFDVGNATARLVVEEWMREYAIGNWFCASCGATASMTSKPGTSGCSSHSGTHHWRYVEPVFVSPQFGISGSVDLLADLGGHKWQVVELKILNVDDFATIKVPLPEHRIRTNLYLKLIADSSSVWKDRINLHEGRVLYVSRGYGKKHETLDEILPFKEYVVKRDDKDLIPYLQQGMAVGMGQKGVYPSGVCSTALDKQAKACSVCKQCFSGMYKATFNPTELEVLA